MTPATETWILVADAAHVRVFEERHRHGDLTELTEWTESAPVDPRKEGAERRFVQDLCDRLVRAGKAGRYERLVLMAPPKLLGLLRERLEPIAGHIEAADAHDRAHAPIHEIRERLHALRMPV